MITLSSLFARSAKLKERQSWIHLQFITTQMSRRSTNTSSAAAETPVNPKVIASIALTFISLLILMPMYYTLYDQRLILSRIEHTRESNGFVLRRLRAQQEHRNMTEALMEPTAADNATRFLLAPVYGTMNKVHLRKQNPKLQKKRTPLSAKNKKDSLEEDK